MGALTLWFGFAREFPFLIVAGVLLIGAGLLGAGGVLLQAGEHRPELWVGGGIVGVALGLALALARPVAGVVLIVAGLTAFRVGTRAIAQRSEASARLSAAAGLGGSFLGAVFVVGGVLRSSLVLIGVGLLLVVMGLIPLTAGWLRPEGARIPPWAIGAAGAVVVLAGVLLWPTERPEWLPWVVALVLVVLGASFSLRLEGPAAVVVVGAVLVLVLTDRVDPAPPDPNPEAPERILAVGDSYTSGEGSSRFLAGTNVVGSLQNQCRRSSTAYPYVVATELGMGLDFFACSGATTVQVHQEGQMGPESPDDVPGEKAQLGNLVDPSRVRLVLISIGGNDAGFGRIGLACGLPGHCDAFREHWLTKVARIGERLETTYRAIKAAVGPSVPVVAVPYPLLLTESGCGWSALERSEHDFLFEFITVMNDRVRRSAERAGVWFFEPGLFVFEGRKICEGNPDDTHMNFLNLVPTEGEFFDQFNPKFWIHGTFHPKPTGHRAMATALIEWVSPLLAGIEAGASPNPKPDPEAAFTIRQVSSVETVAVDPRQVPSGIGCPVRNLSAFGTLHPLLNAKTTVVLHAVPDSPICSTGPDGTWTDDPSVVLTREGTTTEVQPTLPQQGARQLFVYRNAADRRWQQYILEFCNRKPGCPTDVGRWLADQLLATARAAALPVLMMLLGGWLGGVGVSQLTKRASRLPPRTKKLRTPWPGLAEDLEAKPRRALVISAFLLVVAVVGTWQLLSPGPEGSSLRTDETPYGIISLQVAGSADRANLVLQSWEGARLDEAREANLVDYGFIVFYTFLLSAGALAAGECCWAARRVRFWRLGAPVAWAVFAAGLMDGVENLCLARMIDIHAGGGVIAGDALPLAAAILAWPKIVILVLAVVYLGLGTANGLRSWLVGEPLPEGERV